MKKAKKKVTLFGSCQDKDGHGTPSGLGKMWEHKKKKNTADITPTIVA